MDEVLDLHSKQLQEQHPTESFWHSAFSIGC